MSDADQQWVSKPRPMSMVAMNFASALDDLFNLGTVGELKETVEQRSRELSDLDAQLRQADERLKKLDTKYKRMSRQFPARYNMASLLNSDSGHNSSSDTDDLGSPRDEEHPHTLQRLEENKEQEGVQEREQAQQPRMREHTQQRGPQTQR